MPTLHSLIDRLCPQLVEVAHLPPEHADTVVGGFHLPDMSDGSGDRRATQLMLAVRSSTPGDVIEALTKTEGYCAMIVAADAADAAVIEVARVRQVALLTLHPQVSWMHLMGTLYDLFDDDRQSTDVVESMIPGPESDLFEVADWVATQVNAPVTIEDPKSRVIAFSTHSGTVDAARVESIMRREVPHQYLDRMRRHGVFRDLASATEPLFIPGRKPDIDARTAMPVRAGKEMLGSIWVAANEPLPAGHERVLIDSASVVAVQLLRRRQFMGFERRIHADSVRRLLSGDAGYAPELSWLSDSGRDYVVLATALAGGVANRRDMEWERHAVTDAARTHLLAIVPESITGLVDSVSYSIVCLPEPTVSAERALRQSLRDFVRGFTWNGRHHPLHIGIGSLVTRPRDLPESREMADLVIESLADRDRVNEVASIEEVGAQALLLQGRKAVRRSPMLGGASVARLRSFDQEHNTFLTETLYAWLCAHGRFDRAARQLHVHPNTVRYRLRQLRELDVIDLDDPAQRFAAYIHLTAGN